MKKKWAVLNVSAACVEAVRAAAADRGMTIGQWTERAVRNQLRADYGDRVTSTLEPSTGAKESNSSLFTSVRVRPDSVITRVSPMSSA